jgi:hypothetical protein
VISKSSSPLPACRELARKEKSWTYISWAHDAADLLHGVQIGTETTVHCEDLLIDDRCNGQAVEAVGEGLPKLDVVSSLALIVEPIDTVDGRAFVVAAEDEEVFGVFDLVCEEQADGLKRLLASVDIITKEQVVCLRRKSAIFEQTKKVIVLAVNITTNLRSRESSQYAILARGQ